MKFPLFLAFVLACPAAANADYKICTDTGCEVVRTPVRNVVGGAARWATSTVRMHGRSSGTQVVRTYRRGLFGRRICTGTRVVNSAPMASSCSGTRASYLMPTGYRVVETSTPGEEWVDLKNKLTNERARLEANLKTVDLLDDRLDGLLPSATAGNCGCDGKCNCPCCPCKPTESGSEKDRKLSDYPRGVSLKAPKLDSYQLAVKFPQDLRLALR